MFTGNLINQHRMSFNQDINFHRASKHTRRPLASSPPPQRLLSCPNPGGTTDRFKSPTTGSSLSLDSSCSSKDGSKDSGDEEEAPENQGAQGEAASAFRRDTSPGNSLQSSFNSEHSASSSPRHHSPPESTTQGVSDGPETPPPASLGSASLSTIFSGSTQTQTTQQQSIELSEFPEVHLPSGKAGKGAKASGVMKKKKKANKKTAAKHQQTASSTSSISTSEGAHLPVIPAYGRGGQVPVCKDTGSSGSSWYQFMMPSYKSRLSTYHSTFLDIPTTEKLVDDFLCALHRDILLQGRLYLSVHYLAFYSNILGFETKVTVPFTEVKHVSKATTIKLFPNAIEVYTDAGEKYFFTSFVSRDRAFKEIRLLWDAALGHRKMDWKGDVCRMIRSSYSTGNLGTSLSDLEDADVGDHLSKAKTVRKRLQKKMDSQLLSISASSSSAASSTASSVGSLDESLEVEAFEDAPLDLTEGGGGGHHLREDTVDGASHKSLHLEGTSWRRRLASCAKQRLTSVHALLSHERSLLRGGILLAFIALLLQLALFFWLTSFGARVETYLDLLKATLERHKTILQNCPQIPPPDGETTATLTGSGLSQLLTSPQTAPSFAS